MSDDFAFLIVNAAFTLGFSLRILKCSELAY